MVKRTRFRRHPVHMYAGLMLGSEEEYGGVLQLDKRDAAILTAGSQDDTSWSLLDLAAALPPADAVAAILDIQVHDSASSGEDCHMRVATPGIIIAGKTTYIGAPHVNDMIGAKLCIVEISDDDKFAYMIQASGTNFDYDIVLIGWILDPSVTKISMPSVELKAIFVVNQ